jgi:hypothetical protein
VRAWSRRCRRHAGRWHPRDRPRRATRPDSPRRTRNPGREHQLDRLGQPETQRMPKILEMESRHTVARKRLAGLSDELQLVQGQEPFFPAVRLLVPQVQALGRHQTGVPIKLGRQLALARDSSPDHQRRGGSTGAVPVAGRRRADQGAAVGYRLYVGVLPGMPRMVADTYSGARRRHSPGSGIPACFIGRTSILANTAPALRRRSLEARPDRPPSDRP